MIYKFIIAPLFIHGEAPGAGRFAGSARLFYHGGATLSTQGLFCSPERKMGKQATNFVHLDLTIPLPTGKMYYGMVYAAPLFEQGVPAFHDNRRMSRGMRFAPQGVIYCTTESHKPVKPACCYAYIPHGVHCARPLLRLIFKEEVCC